MSRQSPAGHDGTSESVAPDCASLMWVWMWLPASVPDQNPATAGGGGAAKLAATLVAWLTVIEQVGPVPAGAHAPPHPAKLLPPVAVAVSASCVPCTTCSLQSPPCEVADMAQLIPAPVTVPVPVPADPAATVTRYVGGG